MISKGQAFAARFPSDYGRLVADFPCTLDRINKLVWLLSRHEYCIEKSCCCPYRNLTELGVESKLHGARPGMMNCDLRWNLHGVCRQMTTIWSTVPETSKCSMLLGRLRKQIDTMSANGSGACYVTGTSTHATLFSALRYRFL